MSEGAEEKPAVQSADKSKIILIAAFAIVSTLIIVVCLSLTLYILLKKPAQPKTLIIYADESDPAMCALAREDLEKAIRISKDWTISSLKGKPDVGSEQMAELGDMIMAGRIVRIASQTRCVLIESHRPLCKVRVIEGPMNGTDYWVHRNSLAPADIKERSQGLVLAAVLFRYAVTAVICASVLFFLRVRSVLLMLAGFVIGMLILNLLWATTAAAFMPY
jgi:hypothetical protein